MPYGLRAGKIPFQRLFYCGLAANSINLPPGCNFDAANMADATIKIIPPTTES